MKQRFSSLDVKIIAHELSGSLVGLRLGNIHDLSSKIFLFKFAKPGDKKQMILDAGFRCHITAFTRATASFPSAFVSRLRKALQTRRVTSIAQIGTDRIIEFVFSDGLYRLYLEFYAGGNVILTDKDFNVLALQRVVSAGEGQEELRIGLKYVLENKQNYNGIPQLTKERLRTALTTAAASESAPAGGKKIKRKGGDQLRRALAVSIPEYPPILVDHALYTLNFPSTLKPSEVLESEDRLDELMAVLQQAQQVIDDMTSSDPRGYIIAKGSNGALSDGTKAPLVYDDFHPYKPNQFANDTSLTILEFDGFNKTVDEFFSSIEGQKLESHIHEREQTARKKLDSARADQQRRIDGLQQVQGVNVRKAEAIEANVERVQEAMDAVNGLIAQGMDWTEIEKLVEMQQKRQNPVAQIIKLPLKLHENSITLLLAGKDAGDDETDDETDETDSETDSNSSKSKPPVDNRLTVDISLGLSPWNNAGEYYSQKRSAADKEQKTIQSSAKALKSTAHKVEQSLKKSLAQEKPTLRVTRQPLWFEKFIWFVSSDGYLVLGGRDAQQSEMLYRRYLRKGDVYCHADLPGAAHMVIRNISSPDAPIPPSTLSQAGNVAVSASTAWDSKAVMSAWWVDAHQVSKSAAGGGFLPVGSFSIQGDKNFLPPAQLLLGFGIMFRISEASKYRHRKHRITVDEPAPAPRIAETLITTEHAGTEQLIDNDEASEDDSSGDLPRQQNTSHNPLQEAMDEVVTSNQRGQTRGLADVEELSGDVDSLEIGDENPGGADGGKDVVDQQDSDSDAASVAETVAASSTSSKPKGPTPLKRGQKGKARKIAAKYKDQDEEDRLAAQELIGATAGLEKARAEEKAKAEREAFLTEQKERRRAQHQRTENETAQYEEKRRQMMSEGRDVDDDDEAVKLTDMDAFVGTPLPGDEILEAVPMCAPWAAMVKVKYKAKMQPGGEKKGKAVKSIIFKWQADAAIKAKIDATSQDSERIWPREAELIKSFVPEEMINTVPVSKVRVMMSGGSAGGSASKGAPARSKGGKGGKKR